MSRTSSATAPRVGQVTRQLTLERREPFFTEHAARAPGRLPFGLDFAVVPATAMPPGAALGEPPAAGALPELAPGVVPPPGCAGALPVPDSVALVCPAAVWLSVTLSCALREPPADGVNCTPTSHVSPGCTVAPEQDSDSIAKSFAPAIETPVTFSGWLPVLVRTDVFTALACPTSSLPKDASVRLVVMALNRSRPVSPRSKPPGLPPTTSARPSSSAVSVCCLRGAASVPADVQALASGS